MRTRTCSAILSAAASAAAFAGGAFYPLGVTDPESESLAWAASADGTTVVGTDSGRAFRWTAQSGKVLLEVEGAETHTGRGVSANGSVVLGTARIRNVSRAWLLDATSNDPIGVIVEPPNPDAILPFGLSADAGTFVGFAQSQTSPPPGAFRWTPKNGFETLHPDAREAYAVSANGSVIVGGSFPAFRWSEETGFLPLPLPPGRTANAYAVSADGSVIAGEAFGMQPVLAILWESDSYTLLPVLPGATYTAAYAVSGDGRLIAGRSSETGLTGYNAAVWDEGRRVINPNAYFDSIGIDRGGLHLTFIRGLSHDGRTLAGWGERDMGEGQTRREAWVAVLDRPMSCAADLNGDGVVNFGDLNTLLANFGCVGGSCEGDLDGNGAVTFGDLNELLSRFGVRCFDATPAR